MEILNIKLSEIIPYDNNPRINDSAVAKVAESIRQCTYITPIIVDENKIILAGHTRYKALKSLNYENADVIQIIGLTEEQKRKYRLLDNKTSEFSFWDFDKLREELKDLDLEDVEFWFENELDSITQTLDDIDFESITSEKDTKEKEPKKIQCPCCGEWFEK